MDIKTIQTGLDALIPLMLAKGLRNPDANFDMKANQEPNLWLKWERTKTDAYGSKNHYQTVAGATIADMFDAAAAVIAVLPSPEAARHQEFMTALGDVIDLGRQNGIEVAFVNPLVETMKRLSENALTHQVAAE